MTLPHAHSNLFGQTVWNSRVFKQPVSCSVSCVLGAHQRRPARMAEQNIVWQYYQSLGKKMGARCPQDMRHHHGSQG